MKPSKTPYKPTEIELKDIDAKIEEFNREMQRSLPPGLNSPLSRPEKALLRTYILFTLNAHSQQDRSSESSPTE